MEGVKIKRKRSEMSAFMYFVKCHAFGVLGQCDVERLRLRWKGMSETERTVYRKLGKAR